MAERSEVRLDSYDLVPIKQHTMEYSLTESLRLNVFQYA